MEQLLVTEQDMALVLNVILNLIHCIQVNLSNYLSQQEMAHVSNSPRNFLISDSGVFGPTLTQQLCWVQDTKVVL